MVLIQERKKGDEKVAQSNLTHNYCLSAAFYGGGQGALKDVEWFTVKLCWLFLLCSSLSISLHPGRLTSFLTAP